MTQTQLIEALGLDDPTQYVKLLSGLERYTRRNNITDLCFTEDLGTYIDKKEIGSVNMRGHIISILEKGGN